MSMEEIIRKVPRLGGLLGAPPIYIWEHFYFTKVSDDIYNRAEILAKKISDISRGKKTQILSENSDIVGKIGEFVVQGFCDYYLSCEWKSMVEEVNDRGGDSHDFELAGLGVDVKTRQLHADVTIAPNFDIRVPQTELSKYQDVYILAGYCPETNYGYVLGWCSWEELQSQPIRTDIKFPAKCVSLVDLHPMLELEDYARKRSVLCK